MGIALSGGTVSSVTIVSNRFIDHFMPHANGACIKTYLYLLRSLSMPEGTELSISSMAAALGDTEGDILRAVTWLEQCGLIQITRTGEQPFSAGQALSGERTAGRKEGEITKISLVDLPAGGHAPVVEVPVVNVPMVDIPIIKNPANPVTADASKPTTPTGTSAAATGLLTEASSAGLADSSSSKTAASQKQEDLEIPTYSTTQIERLSSNEEVKWVMSIAERYLERLLNPADIQLIVYLYEGAGFPAELILYLYEYCASRDKKSPSYIEKVALNWAKEGIRTVEEAEAASFKYNAHYQAVVRAFGMNRTPGAAEQNYIDRWAKKFGFSADMIEEACNRSLLLTQRPDFKYADRILENWHNDGIKTRQDILRADQLHNQNAARISANKTEGPSRAIPKSNNRFNAFPQRSYSGEEFSSMEQRLLNRNGN